MAFEPVGRAGRYTGEQYTTQDGSRYTWIPTRQRWELSGGTQYNVRANTSPAQAQQNALAAGASPADALRIRNNQINILTNPTQNYLFNASVETGAGNIIRDTQSQVDALVQIDNITDSGTAENIRVNEELQILRGCTDKKALNYKPGASVDDGSCRYPAPVTVPIETIQLKLNVNKPNYVVKVNNRNTLEPLNYTNKELLTPKIITVSKSSYKTNTSYRVCVIEKQQQIENIQSGTSLPIPVRGSATANGRFDDSNSLFDRNNNVYVRPNQTSIADTRITYSYRKYYELKVEKLIDGKFTAISTPTLGNVVKGGKPKLPSVVTLDFLLENAAPPPPDVKFVTLTVKADILDGDVLQYCSEKGEKGYIKNGESQLKLIEDDRHVEFNVIGLSDADFDVRFKLNTEKTSTYGFSRKVKLEGKSQGIEVVIKRKAIDAPDPVPGKTPIVSTKNGSSFRYNVIEKKPLEIYYSSAYATEVRYSLGNVQQKLQPSGVIKLSVKDFPNGIGNYVLYLQGYSEKNGTGPVEKIPVNVYSEEILPGPDITHINYPQLLKGADFKGFDVNFKVSWQSVNTNYVEIFVGKPSKEFGVGRFSNAGAATFNVQEMLRIAGTEITDNLDVVQFPMYLRPWNEETKNKVEGKLEKINITFDKGDLTLRRGVVVNSLRQAWERKLNFEIFRDEISKFLTHYIHTGDGINKLIATWGVDTETFSEYEDGFDANGNPFRNKTKEEKALVLKLYEPLPNTIQNNDTIWISKVQSIPLIEQVTIIDEITQECIPLTPNFNLDVTDDIGYQILDDLVASGSSTSTDLVNKFVSGSDFSLENLNFDFVSGSDYNWKEFVKFSSAEERARNFHYKVKTIQFYENKKTNLTDSQPASGSVSVTNEVNKLNLQIKKLENNFDAFEKFLYTSSSIGGLTYPGAGLNELSASTDSSVTSWLNGIVSSAQRYDETNVSKISSNLPAHIIENSQNDEFLLFFDMIGQHYDILWTHIKEISKVKKLEHKYQQGIGDELIYHLLESLGWNADEGVQSQFLWEFAFGKDKDGTQSRATSGKGRQHEIWRRILNNLPYLLKHKGTKRALHAMLSCYGVPASLLTIMEFGGPREEDSSGTTKFSYEDRTSAINISGSASITVPWKEYSGTSDYPNSVELRVKSNQKQDQQIFSADEWSLHLLKDTGSLAKLQLKVSGSSGLNSASSDSFPYFRDEYIHVAVNKTTSGSDDVFDFYAKEGFQERLRTNVSKQLVVSGVSGWTSGSTLVVGGDTLTGSIDEFRLWSTPLSESRIDNHAFLPDAIDGNHVSSSTEDLIFRNDFEYPKNRHSGGDPYIKNVATTLDYAVYSTASNFENEGSYPYQYTPYDRTVTATVPSTGFNYSNKIRVETQSLLSDLNYRSRATKKSLDGAPIDTDKLGLFFSPIKEINMDILKSIGAFNIDDYIGNPSDEYEYEYKKLADLRDYYFDRYTLNLHEYIQLVRYIDKSLFSALESLLPARVKPASGLLIEPHILERSKTKWTKPTGEENYHETKVDVNQDVIITSTNDQYQGEISASDDVVLTGQNPQYIGIATDSTASLSGESNDYLAVINTEDDTILTGVITRNSGSDMAGFDITINAQITGSVQGAFDATEFVQVGNDPNGISNQTFGIYAENGHANITRIDKDNNIIRERKKVFIIKESYTIQERQNIDSSDSSLGTQLVDVTKHKFTVTKLPITGSDGLATPAPSVGGNIVEVTALDGYSKQHYKFVEDVTAGLENSFFNGCLQTSATTIDGSAPVQTFTTNPNTLKVSDAGRGSGEPILEVD